MKISNYKIKNRWLVSKGRQWRKLFDGNYEPISNIFMDQSKFLKLLFAMKIFIYVETIKEKTNYNE